MRTRTRLAATVCLLALLAFGVWLAVRSAEKPAPRAGESIAPTEPSVLVATDSERNAPAERLPLAATTDSTASETHAIRGLVLRPDGTPSVGAEVTLAREPDTFRVRPPVRVEPWIAPSTRTDAEGEFLLRFEGSPGHPFAITIDAPECVPLGWRWIELPSEPELYLDDARLVAAATLRGRVVDAHGRALIGSWQVAIPPPGAGLYRDGRPMWSAVEVDPVHGTFLIERVPAGALVLRAKSDLGAETKLVQLDPRPGETRDVELVYDGVDLSRRIVVETRFDPLPFLADEIDLIELEGPAGTRRNDWRASKTFDDLDPGTYTVRVTDARFEPWEQHGVRGGTRVVASLRGRARVALRVVDVVTGLPIERCDVLVRVDIASSNSCGGPGPYPRSYLIHSAEEPWPADGVFDGIVLGGTSLVVRTPDRRESSAALSFAPGATQAITLNVGAGATIEGVVLDCDGATPAVGATVDLREPGAVLDAGDDFASNVRRLHVAGTDANGRFRFAPLDYGVSRVRASSGGVTGQWIDVAREVGGASDLITLKLPPCGRLHGTIAIPADARRRGLELQALWTNNRDPNAPPTFTLGRPRAELELHADGSYATQVLQAGMWRMQLQLAPPWAASISSERFYAAGPAIELGVVDVVGGEDRAYDFTPDALWPGGLVVHVDVPGVSVAWEPWIVSAFLRKTEGAFVQTYGQQAIASRTSNAARIGPLWPGEYTVTVESDREGWIYALSQRVEVTSEADRELHVVVPLHAGVVVVNEANGSPAVSRDIVVSTSAAGRSARRFLRTNERGEVDLRFAPGQVAFAWPLGTRALGTDSSAVIQPQTIDWTPAGPVRATVTLPARR